MTSDGLATTAALDELYGLGYDYHDRFADEVKRVDLSAGRDVARAGLVWCVVTISTPEPHLVTVKTGRREFNGFAPST